MPTVYGKIIDVDTKRRTIDIIHRGKKKTCYLQRSKFNTFSSFLRVGHFAVLRVSKPKRKRDYVAYTVRDVKKLIQPIAGKRRVLFSTVTLKREIRTFINTLGAKLYLDFEMSMHPYKVDKGFIQEIIQVGYVLEDENGKILKTYKTCIQPSRHKKLTKRTLKFLDLTQADVDQGVSYQAFYDPLKTLIMTHEPAIIVWGRNDYLSLKESYQVNKVTSLSGHTRFVNLLKLHKNYFNFKNDLGLKRAYEMYGHEKENQRHDALEDAQMTRKIFHGFKNHMNDPETYGLIPKKESA